MHALVAQVEALRHSEPAAALERLEAGFAAALKRADASGRGTLWRLRAHVLRSLRRAREAAAAYRRAAEWYAKAGDAREQGRCAIGLVDALMYLGRYAEARRAAARGRKLLEASGDRSALARLLNNEGNLWHRLDLPERALECYRAAVKSLERAGDAGSALMIGANVGNCLSLLGRCDVIRAEPSGDTGVRFVRSDPTARIASGKLFLAVQEAWNKAPELTHSALCCKGGHVLEPPLPHMKHRI